MLGAVAPGECLRDRLSTRVATVMAQTRQHLRIALAGKDRADDAQAGRAGDVGDDVVELKIHLCQCLLHIAGCVRPRTPADARADAHMRAARQSVLWAESWHAATRTNGAAAATAHR